MRKKHKSVYITKGTYQHMSKIVFRPEVGNYTCTLVVDSQGKREREREFFVDSGASMHLMGGNDLTAEEAGKNKSFENLMKIMTASGTVCTSGQGSAVGRFTGSFFFGAIMLGAWIFI